MKRIEVENIVMGTGTPSFGRGIGPSISSKQATMWIEEGFLFIQLIGTGDNTIRMFHPANIEIKPKAGQFEPLLQAVSGGKK